MAQKINVTLTAGVPNTAPIAPPSDAMLLGAHVNFTEDPPPGVTPGARRVPGAVVRGFGQQAGDWWAFVEYDGSAGPTVEATVVVYQL